MYEVFNCECGAQPGYFGSDTWGYFECPKCHRRTRNYIDVDVRIDYYVDEHGNEGFWPRHHEPNAWIMAAEAWNNRDYR